MRDKRSRAIELLRRSMERLELLLDHLDHMDFDSAEDLARAQSDPHDYDAYRDFDFVAHQVDLATEGIRQIREMRQSDVIDALSKHVDGNVNDFIGLHTHLFHTYDGISADILWDVVKVDCPMMIDAIRHTLEDLAEGQGA